MPLSVNRSLSILVVTIVVVVAAYYGFSRFASTSEPPGNPTQAPLVATQNATGKAAPTAEGAGQPPAPTSASASPPAASIGTDGAEPPHGAFSIVIDKAHPPAPTDVIRVSKDDPVTLSITTDRAGNLEVHGYRKEVKVQPGTMGTLSFVANMTGRFPIDLHASDGEHVEVTALEVMPK
ncbi:MAG TPA: hypothetical protein VKV24_09120 [Casimicrobiaceae bacterium]|nr:hypothetical protein [Casimicrobiaceae bacterium]